MDNIAVMTNRIKDAKQRLEFMVNGTEFEAQIVGVQPMEQTSILRPLQTLSLKSKG